MGTDFIYNDPGTILRFSRGDAAAFRIIFEELFRPLCFFAYKLLDQKEEAEDITSTAFATLWERRAQFDHPGAVKSFLYITVRNACYDLLKHRKVVYQANDVISEIGSQPDITVDARILQSELLQTILAELSNLPDRSRQILEWSYLEEKKTSEIASLLSMTESHVRMERSRGLVLLRKSLKEKHLLELALLLVALLKK